MKIDKPSARGFKIYCGVVTIFILIVAIILITSAFTVFKLKEPIISLYPQRSDNISLGSGGFTTANITVAVMVAINNRNYGSFRFKNTKGFVNYRENVVGDFSIRQSRVPARSIFNISVDGKLMMGRLISKPVFFDDFLNGGINFTSEATLYGKVKMFNILNLHATVPNTCYISISVPSQDIVCSCKTGLKLHV